MKSKEGKILKTLSDVENIVTYYLVLAINENDTDKHIYDNRS